MAKAIVEWMDEWEWVGLDHAGTKHNEPKFEWIEDTGLHRIPHPAYWYKLKLDRNIQQVVIQELESAPCPQSPNSDQTTGVTSVRCYLLRKEQKDLDGLLLADSEIIFKALYQTIKELDQE